MSTFTALQAHNGCLPMFQQRKLQTTVKPQPIIITRKQKNRRKQRRRPQLNLETTTDEILDLVLDDAINRFRAMPVNPPRSNHCEDEYYQQANYHPEKRSNEEAKTSCNVSSSTIPQNHADEGDWVVLPVDDDWVLT